MVYNLRDFVCYAAPLFLSQRSGLSLKLQYLQLVCDGSLAYVVSAYEPSLLKLLSMKSLTRLTAFFVFIGPDKSLDSDILG